MRDADTILTILPEGSLPSKGTATGLEAGKRLGKPMYTVHCIRILKEEPRGVLSMFGDDGYPKKELKALPRVQCLELILEHMTGKPVNEA